MSQNQVGIVGTLRFIVELGDFAQEFQVLPVDFIRFF